MAATRVQLDVSIDPGGAAFTVPELRALLPDLQLEVTPALERSSVRFSGRIEADGEESDVSRIVAGHLETLRQFSRQFSNVSITVAEPPDGGELRLQGGSFGTDEDELTSLLASITGAQKWRLYVSVRIERDAHAHLTQLIERAMIAGITPVFEPSDNALAVGFETSGSADRVADLVNIMRFAWRQEGSEAESLIEVEGPVPIVEIARTWAEWVAIEQRLRLSASVTTHGRAHTHPPPRKVELQQVGDAAGVLGDTCLSWIDAEDQIFGIWRGTMYSLSERVEAGDLFHGQLLRTAGGALHFEHGATRVTLPEPPDGSERRLHKFLGARALFSDTAGTAHATTRLMLAGAKGIDEGRQLAHVRALDACDTEAFALADGRDGVALLQIHLGDGWGYAEARPWHPEETGTDLAIVSDSRIAVIAERGARSTLYLVERQNLVYGRRIALPCVAAQIVAHSRETIWITGMSAPPGPSRCDLFRVDVLVGTVTLVTAELDARTLECVASSGSNALGLQLLFATNRTVFITASDGVHELTDLAPDETITGMVSGSSSAVFVQSPRGSSVILGAHGARIPLPTAGFEPLVHDDVPFES